MSGRPDRVILVYDGDSGVRAMLLDVVKKVVGREDCALCEITYSPVGKRPAWRACERRLGVVVEELHRDRVPAAWRLTAADLPCVLARVGDSIPVVAVTRDEIIACRGSMDALERRIAQSIGAAAPEGITCPAVSR